MMCFVNRTKKRGSSLIIGTLLHPAENRAPPPSEEAQQNGARYNTIVFMVASFESEFRATAFIAIGPLLKMLDCRVGRYDIVQGNPGRAGIGRAHFGHQHE